jgi:hypothetical protein
MRLREELTLVRIERHSGPESSWNRMAAWLSRVVTSERPELGLRRHD